MTVEHHVHPAAVWPVWVGIAVAVTAVGGLAIADVLAGGVLLRAVPVWTIPVACALVAALLSLRRKHRRSPSRQVFFVTSAFSQKYWLAGLVQRLHGVLDRNGIDLVLKVPDRDYDAAAQAHHLRRIVTASRDYVGGFVLASEVHRLRPDLVEFCAELAVPVVFTDVEPFDDESRYPDNAAFVGYLSADIGTLAGHWLVAHLKPKGLPRPHVLIVASREHRDRQEQCAAVLRDGLTDVVITVHDGCAFCRSRAYDAVCSHVDLLDPGRDRLDAVFCTNDEMALGAVDALRAANSPVTADTVVIGVDGTLEVRTMIDDGTSPLRATVVQDSHRLAECAFHVLERMHNHRETSKRTILNPEVYQGRTTGGG
ncbi:sugar ABC transporter substrate-binding protein [Saccharothrix tamanrassetensis]|nr:substrate-binding domain-containing protein [Saccharothrix tamanrassetensis]